MFDDPNERILDDNAGETSTDFLSPGRDEDTTAMPNDPASGDKSKKDMLNDPAHGDKKEEAMLNDPAHG